MEEPELKSSKWHGITWYMSYKYIEWQIIQRDNNDKEVQAVYPALNISVIISCCYVIEGFLFTIIEDYIRFAKTKSNISKEMEEIYERQIRDYSNQLDNASFNRYKDLFTLFSGEKISDKTNDECLKAVTLMFQFRNQLVHGNEIELIYTKGNGNNLENVEIFGKYKKILTYGKEKDLIIIDNDKLDFLNNKFIDHFFYHTTQFICELFEFVNGVEGLVISADIFAIKQRWEKLNSIKEERRL